MDSFNMHGAWLPVPASAVFRCSLCCALLATHTICLGKLSPSGEKPQISKTVPWTLKGVWCLRHWCVFIESVWGLAAPNFSGLPWQELTRPCREAMCGGKVSCDLGTTQIVTVLPFPSCTSLSRSLMQCPAQARNIVEATEASMSFTSQPWVIFMGKLFCTLGEANALLSLLNQVLNRSHMGKK